MDERMEGRMVMEGRRKLTLTGAKEVLRFDEELAELSTALGNLTDDYGIKRLIALGCQGLGAA